MSRVNGWKRKGEKKSKEGKYANLKEGGMKFFTSPLALTTLAVVRKRGRMGVKKERVWCYAPRVKPCDTFLLGLTPPPE